MDTLSTASWWRPSKAWLSTAVEWLLGTEPPREIRGRLIDGARLYRGEALAREGADVTGASRVTLPEQGVRPASLYLVRRDGTVVGFDAAGNRRLAAFQASDRGALDVVVRAGKKLDGTYKVISVVSCDASPRMLDGQEREAWASSTSGRSGARARTRGPVQVPSQLWQ